MLRFRLIKVLACGHDQVQVHCPVGAQISLVSAQHGFDLNLARQPGGQKSMLGPGSESRGEGIERPSSGTPNGAKLAARATELRPTGEMWPGRADLAGQSLSFLLSAEAAALRVGAEPLFIASSSCQATGDASSSSESRQQRFNSQPCAKPRDVSMVRGGA
ncbi:unnamed protein product [Protopolystoma xenopodis]|uniref:Uncharacterized protein n=1 Tax=Protopolystoma xenopodis TaxID=117903 RepID=A0A448X4R1_9PLAT|nr:unnamed protein product [Protopolystoma xenopodis]